MTDDAEPPAVKRAVCEGRVSSRPPAQQVALLGHLPRSSPVSESVDDPVFVGFVQLVIQLPFVRLAVRRPCWDSVSVR